MHWKACGSLFKRRLSYFLKTQFLCFAYSLTRSVSSQSGVYGTQEVPVKLSKDPRVHENLHLHSFELIFLVDFKCNVLCLSNF